VFVETFQVSVSHIFLTYDAAGANLAISIFLFFHLIIQQHIDS